ncbi:MAG: metallophosphoesterase [Bacteroidetes bacterium]|nr:metallophosphoesterase [Bacteroidota bacterium]
MTTSKMAPDSRRKFIKNISLASALLLTGKWTTLSAAEVLAYRDKVKLRFVVASDAHYGQPGTPYEQMMDTITQQINLFHQQSPLDFCVMNGDLIHNEKSFMPLVKSKLDILTMPLYVTRGNHDMVSDAYWNEIWGMPLNHDVVVKDNAILLGDTSNEKGLYVSPNLDWLSNKLEQHKNKKHCFIFLHIPQAKWTANGIDTPAVFEIIKKYPNVKAVFHGHEHDQDGVKMVEKVPFLFDAHIGGNWGTPYKGFRVVELMKDNTMITYMMNPTDKMKELSL